MAQAIKCTIISYSPDCMQYSYILWHKIQFKNFLLRERKIMPGLATCIASYNIHEAGAIASRISVLSVVTSQVQ